MVKVSLFFEQSDPPKPQVKVLVPPSLEHGVSATVPLVFTALPSACCRACTSNACVIHLSCSILRKLKNPKSHLYMMTGSLNLPSSRVRCQDRSLCSGNTTPARRWMGMVCRSIASSRLDNSKSAQSQARGKERQPVQRGVRCESTTSRTVVRSRTKVVHGVKKKKEVCTHPARATRLRAGSYRGSHCRYRSAAKPISCREWTVLNHVVRRLVAEMRCGLLFCRIRQTEPFRTMLIRNRAR